MHCIRLCIHLFFHLLIHSFTHFFIIHSFLHLLIHLYVHAVTRSFIQLFNDCSNLFSWLASDLGKLRPSCKSKNNVPLYFEHPSLVIDSTPDHRECPLHSLGSFLSKVDQYCPFSGQTDSFMLGSVATVGNGANEVVAFHFA